MAKNAGYISGDWQGYCCMDSHSMNCARKKLADHPSERGNASGPRKNHYCTTEQAPHNTFSFFPKVDRYILSTGYCHVFYFISFSSLSWGGYRINLNKREGS